MSHVGSVCGSPLFEDPLNHPPAATSAPRSSVSVKELHLPPSEVWAIIFDYGGPGAVPVQVDQIFRFRLLYRFITAGLDEWLLLAMEQGVKRDGTLRLVPANPNRSDSPIQVQKLGLLALSNAPKEFFLASTQLGGDFLTYNPWSGKNWSLMSRNRPREFGSVESSPPSL